jgi:2-dehydropantoate 2-reductase
LKIAVVGSGAVGNVLAVLLANAGDSVTLIDENELHVAAVNSQGLWMDGALGHLHATVAARQHMIERPDICFLNTATQDITKTLQLYKQFLSDVPVITLQDSPQAANLAASVLGKRYILSAAVLFGAGLRPGHVTYPVAGSLIIGEPFESTGFAESVVASLGRIIPTVYVDNIHGAQWTKLITTLHHGLAAATGLTAGQAAEHPDLRQLSVAIMKEGADVMMAAGIQLQTLPGLPPVNKMVSILHMPLPASEMVPRLLSKIERDMAAAELIVAELKHEGKIAIEYINGEVAQLGRQIGQYAPCNEIIVKIIQQLTANGQHLTPQQLLETVEAETQTPTRLP